MDVGENCLTLLRSARTDQEKFASLLVVARTVEANKLPSLQKRQIFDAIGFPFLKRTLKKTDIPEGCSSNIYKSVAIAILAAFCSDPELAVNDHMCDCIDSLRDSLTNTSHTAEEEALTDDVLQCFYSMSLQDKGRQCLLENSVIPILTDIFVEDQYGCNLAFEVISHLSYHCGCETWNANHSSFTKLMNKLARDFHSEDSWHKFELCQTLADILLKYPLCRSNPDEQWCLQIQMGLCNIFRCQLTKAQRDPAFKLASMMVEKFGAPWFMEETENTKKFFSLLVHLICIEVCMALEDKKTKDIVADIEILSCCYNMLENIISIMIDETLCYWTERHNASLLPQLKNTFEAIGSFILLISQEWESWSTDPTETGVKVRELTYATVRALCSWLAEDSQVINKITTKVLPFLLKIARDSFIDAKIAQDKKSTAMVVHQLDLMRFLIPALCHLSVDDNARAILINEKAHKTLLDYLEYQWNILQRSSSVAEEISGILSTLCGIFLNIVVLETKFVSEDDTFFYLLKIIMTSLPQLIGHKFLMLRANFSVLGFFITKSYYRRVKSCETMFYKFLASGVKFLWDAHCVETVNDSTKLIVAHEYIKFWNDLVELWFLGMQSLSNLLPLMPWLAGFLMESGWPRYMLTSLDKVPASGVDNHIKSAYQDFLCRLIQCSPSELAPQVCEITNVEELCKVHSLRHLQSLLFP